MKLVNLVDQLIINPRYHEIHQLAAMCANHVEMVFNIEFYPRFFKFLESYIYMFGEERIWIELFVDDYILRYNGDYRKIKLGNWGNKRLLDFVNKDIEKNYKQAAEILMRLMEAKHEIAVTNYVLMNWEEEDFWKFAKKALLKDRRKNEH